MTSEARERPTMTETTPPQSAKPTPKLWLHTIADVVAILVVGVWVALGKLDATYGVLFIAIVLGLKLPAKGGGITTVLLPLAQLLRNGNGRWLS